MVSIHGPERALVKAIQCTSSHVAASDVMAAVLDLPGMVPRADCLGGAVLVEAARNGCLAAMRMLLSREGDAHRANCQEGVALVAAAKEGQIQAMMLLLMHERNAPRTDCRP